MGLYEKVGEEKLDNSIIDTELDMIVSIVNHKKQILLEEISKKLEMPVKKVEYWAKKLADKGLIQFTYPVVGDAILSTHKIEHKEKRKPNKALNLTIFTLALIIIFTIIIYLLKKYNYIY